MVAPNAAFDLTFSCNSNKSGRGLLSCLLGAASISRKLLRFLHPLWSVEEAIRVCFLKGIIEDILTSKNPSVHSALKAMGTSIVREFNLLCKIGQESFIHRGRFIAPAPLAGPYVTS